VQTRGARSKQRHSSTDRNHLVPLLAPRWRRPPVSQVKTPRRLLGGLAGFFTNHSEQGRCIAEFPTAPRRCGSALPYALGSLDVRPRGAFALGYPRCCQTRVDGLAAQFRSCLIGKMAKPTGGRARLSAPFRLICQSATRRAHCAQTPQDRTSSCEASPLAANEWCQWLAGPVGRRRGEELSENRARSLEEA